MKKKKLKAKLKSLEWRIKEMQKDCDKRFHNVGSDEQELFIRTDQQSNYLMQIDQELSAFNDTYEEDRANADIRAEAIEDEIAELTKWRDETHSYVQMLIREVNNHEVS